ncbi:MAG: DUF1080 domain-containing protein [Planctomycetia bacterium]|nr:DUF1080 domain-containing protein [Planctomycetia bacterium]
MSRILKKSVFQIVSSTIFTVFLAIFIPSVFLMLVASNLKAEDLPVTKVNKKMDLFNGQNLDGWYKWIQNQGKNNDPAGVFTVRDGMIRVSGETWGCITTEKSYSNYRIVVEYKWGEKTWGGREKKARDSGLLIHTFGEDGDFGGIWAKSVEANICEGATGDFWIVGDGDDGISATCKATRRKNNKLVYDPENGESVTLTSNSQGGIQNRYGSVDYRDEKDFRGPDDVEKADEWNTLTVDACGNKMTVYVNGVLVNEITDLKQDAGKIQLQSEGAEIFFRKISLEPLTK